MNSQIGCVANLLSQHPQITEGTLGVKIVTNDPTAMFFQPDSEVKSNSTLAGTTLEVSDNSDHYLNFLPFYQWKT
jgi:hypothetical protein